MNPMKKTVMRPKNLPEKHGLKKKLASEPFRLYSQAYEKNS